MSVMRWTLLIKNWRNGNKIAIFLSRYHLMPLLPATCCGTSDGLTTSSAGWVAFNEDRYCGLMESLMSQQHQKWIFQSLIFFNQSCVHYSFCKNCFIYSVKRQKKMHNFKLFLRICVSRIVAAVRTCSPDATFF